MAALVEIAADQITARYHGLGRYLELTAKGSVPAFWLEPFFTKEINFGGLLYSIKAFVGGPGPVGIKGESTPFNITTKLQILLPLEHFNSKTVAVETAKGTWNIDIEYIAWPGPPAEDKATNLLAAVAPAAATPAATGGNNINAGQRYSDVLTPIHETLLIGTPLKITAYVPTIVTQSKTWVKPSFNPAYIKLVNAEHEFGAIIWTFEWNTAESGPDPQIIDITTTTWNGLFGASSVTSKIIQPYIIKGIVLDK